MDNRETSSCAIILAGAVSYGAFEAGALEVLVQRLEQENMSIACVVGASAGALNAAVLAAHICRGTAVDGAKKLVRLWQEKAHWGSFIWPPSPRSWVHLSGFCDTNAVADLIEQAIGTDCGANPVDLRIVLTTLKGEPATPRSPASSPCGLPTTFEHVAEFSASSFSTADGRRHIAEAAAGSAAFPVLFAPRDVRKVGPCLDGGIVNNTPISEALKAGRISTIFVIAAYPEHCQGTARVGGAGLALHVADILIHERLYRDIREAEAVNNWLREIDRQKLSADQRDAIIRALYPSHSTRPLQILDIVQIRPCQPLAGTVFSGFCCERWRAEYIDKGRAVAEERLKNWGPTDSTGQT